MLHIFDTRPLSHYVLCKVCASAKRMCLLGVLRSVVMYMCGSLAADRLHACTRSLANVSGCSWSRRHREGTVLARKTTLVCAFTNCMLASTSIKVDEKTSSVHLSFPRCISIRALLSCMLGLISSHLSCRH